MYCTLNENVLQTSLLAYRRRPTPVCAFTRSYAKPKRTNEDVASIPAHETKTHILRSGLAREKLRRGLRSSGHVARSRFAIQTGQAKSRTVVLRAKLGMPRVRNCKLFPIAIAQALLLSKINNFHRKCVGPIHADPDDHGAPRTLLYCLIFSLQYSSKSARARCTRRNKTGGRRRVHPQPAEEKHISQTTTHTNKRACLPACLPFPRRLPSAREHQSDATHASSPSFAKPHRLIGAYHPASQHPGPRQQQHQVQASPLRPERVQAQPRAPQPSLL